MNPPPTVPAGPSSAPPAAGPPASRIEAAVAAVARDPVLTKMLDEERVESAMRDARLAGRLVTFLRPHAGFAALAAVSALVEAIVVVLPTFAVGLALDDLTRTAREPLWLDEPVRRAASLLVGGAAPGTGAYVALSALLWALRWSTAVVTSYAVAALGQRVVRDVRDAVYTHITSLDMQFFHANPVGRLVNRTTFDVQAVAELFSDAFAQGARDALFVMMLFGLLLTLDAPLAVVVIAAFPVLLGAALGYRAYARPALRTVSAVQSRTSAWLAENLSGMRENHLYRTQARRAAEIAALSDAYLAANAVVVRSWALFRPTMLITTGAATSAVLLVGYDRAVDGVVSVGVLVTFLSYTSRLWVPIRNLAEKFTIIQTGLTAAERIVQVLDTRARLTDAPDADPALSPTAGAVAFEHVSFRYPGNHRDTLTDVSFSVAPGKMLALVGDTGAGKSTIVKLVSRFYDVTDGRVTVDGHDVRRYTLERLRRGAALVPQEVVVFAGSLRDNLTLGAEVDDAVVHRALTAVGAGGLVERLPGGLDHVLAESGRTLSVGERQLLSFARALIVNPPILILDEATANVDTETERNIQRGIEELTAGRTSIVVAHRLSTIRKADEILVIRDGRIAERGTHAGLLAAGGAYARLHRLYQGEERRRSEAAGTGGFTRAAAAPEASD